MLHAFRKQIGTRVLWPAAGLVFGFALIGVTNWLINRGDEREHRRHVERLELLTATVTTELGAKLEKIRANLWKLHANGMAGGHPDPEAIGNAATDDWPALQASGIIGISAIDADGRIVYEVPGGVSTEAPLAIAHRRAGASGPFLAQPVRSEDGRTNIPLVIPLDAAGSLAGGTIVAFVSGDALSQLRALDDQPADLTIDLLIGDTHFPLTRAAIKTNALPDDTRLLYGLQTSSYGSFREAGPDGTRFQTAYADLRGFGAVTVGRLNVELAMADKRSESSILLAIAMAVCLALQLVAVQLLHYMDRLHETSAGLREAEASERQRAHELHATLDAMIQGAIVVDADRKIAVANATFQALGDIRDEWVAPGVDYDSLVEWRLARGDFGDVKTSADLPAAVTGIGLSGHEARHEHQRADGVVIDVRTRPLADGGFIVTLTDITEHRRTLQRIHKLAAEDSLTQLANRRQFHEELARDLGRRERGDVAAVLLVDLDRFKQVNDTLGHPVGDKLLQLVAARIAASTRAHDLVARLGGDEFAILQREIRAVDDARRLARRILESVSEPYEIDGHHVEIGVSIGIALAPHDGDDGETLLKAADAALYYGKNGGRGAAYFFDASMGEKIARRRDLESDLRLGVERREFQAHYQPIQDLTTGRIIGFEALCRWQHPTRGLVSPADFIPVAEETGLIVQIGAQVLELALRQAAEWPDDVWLAVNLSPVQLKTPSLLPNVLEILKQTGICPRRLELEITEAVILQNDPVVTANLNALDSAGIRLAIDDFGTGYSSMSYLQRFPFKKVKIDRSFIAAINASSECQAIVEASALLAKRLGLAATAEGIETTEELAIVKRLGCNQAQGYLLGRPVDAALTRLLAWRDGPSEHLRAS